MAEGKWIDDLSGDVPWTSAARHVLKARLEAVSDRLPDRDPPIGRRHRTRPSTSRQHSPERARPSALSANPHAGEDAHAVKKRLKRIRRAAGEARDWDVFLEMIAQRRKTGDRTQRAGLDFLLGYGQGQPGARPVASGRDATARRRGSFRLSSATWSIPFPTIRRSARSAKHAIPLLTTLARELDAAASKEFDGYEEFAPGSHSRQTARHAMEIFASCFEAEFARRSTQPSRRCRRSSATPTTASTPAVASGEIQTRLDRTLPTHAAVYRKGIDTLVKYHQRRLGDQPAALREVAEGVGRRRYGTPAREDAEGIDVWSAFRPEGPDDSALSRLTIIASGIRLSK